MQHSAAKVGQTNGAYNEQQSEPRGPHPVLQHPGRFGRGRSDWQDGSDQVRGSDRPGQGPAGGERHGAELRHRHRDVCPQVQPDGHRYRGFGPSVHRDGADCGDAGDSDPRRVQRRSGRGAGPG